MQAYLVRKAAELGIYVYAVNNWYDHVHLVVAIPPKRAVTDVVKHLKGASSHHLNHCGELDYAFAWQRGYGALSLGESQKPKAEAYVNNQKRHHEKQTTNDWLEYYTEFDEGPEDTGLTANHVSSHLHEVNTRYETWEAMPF